MTSLARVSLANRALVALVAITATIFGIFAIPSLKQELLPSLEFPAAVVVAPYLGATPELVEDQVAEPIESAVRAVDGVDAVTSTSRDGSATVQVEFEYGTPVGDAVSDLQQAINRISSQLPEDVEPTVVAGSTANLPAVVLAVSSDADQRQLADDLRRSVLPELQAITGVREATVTGARADRVVVTPNGAALAAARVQPTAVADVLRSNGVSIPAGSLTDGEQSLNVQVGQKLTSVDEVRGLYLPGAQLVRLGDVATVEQVATDATSITRTNGQDSLGVSLTLTPDGNAVDVSHRVRELLPSLTTALGGGGALTVVFDQAPFVEKSIEGLTTEGALGLAFAVLVILVFLFSVRSTLVTAVSIPLSVVIALIALWAGGLSLNILTLGGLTIAIGRVVDDSIVVLENIKRHLGYGEDKQRAVLDGVKEVAGAVTASTLTTVAVFLPIALTGGMVGELFSAFAITVTVALLASLLVSLTVIPVLAYWFLRPSAGETSEEEVVEQERRSFLQRAYLPVLRFATTRRWATVLVAVLLFGGTLALVPRLETNFIDSSGQNTLSIRQELPPGTGLAATDAAAKRVEEVLADVDAVETHQVTIGSGGGGFAAFAGGGDTGTASFSITLAEDSDTAAVEQELRTRTEGLDGDITVGAGGGGGFNATSVEVAVQATDAEVLRTASEAVRAAVQDTPGLTDVTSDLAESTPRVQIALKREAAARAGLTDTTAGQVVAQAFRGAPVTQLSVDGEQLDVVLRSGAAPATLDEVRNLPLPTAAGIVRLGEVADVTEVAGPVQIKRVDGERSATVSATATEQNIGAVTADLQQRLDAVELPEGATFSIGGVSADQQDAFGDLGLALLVAVALVFTIMVVTFRSLIQPLILLVSIPFAATGAIVLLLVSGTPLGVPALIGVLMLVGIVVTNAIVLMDLINQYRAQGAGIIEAVVEGGRRRLRPILMTAAATIFALVPMALGVTGSGGFISQPLAIVVIGGLISSTLLTLVLVPTLYTVVENTKERIARRRAAKRGTPATPEPDLVDA
ncbi:efflux RND transporter permease subunit [Umezawaea beigongshangensis]|uniref:efflux RND transporter permease subunit n=1 Tax=Umezawaea beigongshangensis TaxID=2780383 RepID=UPI0018F2450D|nr:efflux RND transporter permease subunit [Umezawaea beigongshangensis]